MLQIFGHTAQKVAVETELHQLSEVAHLLRNMVESVVGEICGGMKGRW